VATPVKGDESCSESFDERLLALHAEAPHLGQWAGEGGWGVDGGRLEEREVEGGPSGT
jgi:hypothetical protein